MESRRYYLKEAVSEAEIAFCKQTYPVGAIIVGPDDTIIGRGHNQVYSAGDFTSHAEMQAIRDAGSILMNEHYYEKCTLYTTLEPCFMCCGAILHARIKEVIWIMDDNEHGVLRKIKSSIRDTSNKHNDLMTLYDKTGFFNGLYCSKIYSLKAGKADEKLVDHIIYELMEEWCKEKKSRTDYWKAMECGHYDIEKQPAGSSI